MSDLSPDVASVVALSPLDLAEPDSITALFDMDPTKLSDAALDKLIGELRTRADRFKAEEAAKEAAPSKPKRVKAAKTDDPADQALRDKPVEDLTLGDLFGDD